MFKGLSLLMAGNLFFAALPATTNYGLKGYGFGSGGGSTSTANYSLQGISGEVNGSIPSTANYTLKPGFIQTEQANVPLITLSNPSNYYDKLTFAINTTSPNNPNNPSDALYALQVKVSDPTCDFTSGTIRYVKNDNTIGTTLTTADYQTYAAWVSGGQQMIGLASSTTYCIRAKVTQGAYTESAYGPSSSSAATVGQSISFCLYTGASCGLGSNSIAFGTININSVNNSPNNIGTDFATNANNGGSVYIYSNNGGVKSTSNGYTITSASANLAAVSEGFGAQTVSVGQSSGGPLSKVSPYNGAANNVGALTTTVSVLLNSSAPVVGGTASTQLQIKPSYNAVPKTDYSETLTLIAAGNW